MTQQISFGEFMKHLVGLLAEHKVVMPLKDERRWHSLFYKMASKDGAPVYLTSLRFDWDGPFPKCQEVSQFLHALHWNAGVSAMNPHYEQFELPPEVAELWRERRGALPADALGSLDAALQIAQQDFEAAGV